MRRRLVSLVTAALAGIVVVACSTAADPGPGDSGVGDPDVAGDEGPSTEVPDDDQGAAPGGDEDGDTDPGAEPAEEPDDPDEAPVAHGPLDFSARSLTGGTVELATFADGPVVLWMWTPW